MEPQVPSAAEYYGSDQMILKSQSGAVGEREPEPEDAGAAASSRDGEHARLAHTEVRRQRRQLPSTAAAATSAVTEDE